MDYDMDDMLDERYITAAVRYLRERYGVTYFPILAIVYGMACEPGADYPTVLGYWAERDCEAAGFPQAEAWWWHNEICRYLLKADADVSGGVEHWFENRAKELRRLED